jgi:hypothetical protein
MLARWTCTVCACTLVAPSARLLRSRRTRHEVACGVTACLAWHDGMRAAHLASSLIAPDSPQSSVPFMVDLRAKVHANA